MTTLTTFLLARIAEDEEGARLAMSATALLDHGVGAEGVPETSSLVAQYATQVREANPLPWSPAHALAECEAKRAIVQLGECFTCNREGQECTHQHNTLVLLAGVYSYHPDYDPAWTISE